MDFEPRITKLIYHCPESKFKVSFEKQSDATYSRVLIFWENIHSSTPFDSTGCARLPTRKAYCGGSQSIITSRRGHGDCNMEKHTQSMTYILKKNKIAEYTCEMARPNQTHVLSNRRRTLRAMCARRRVPGQKETIGINCRVSLHPAGSNTSYVRAPMRISPSQDRIFLFFFTRRGCLDIENFNLICLSSKTG